MAYRVDETIEVRAPPQVAFAYVADFANTRTWDPGIDEASLRSDPPVRLGSRFDLVSNFGGRTLPLTYEITGFEAPRRVVLVGDGDGFHGVDEITFEPWPAGGTRVRYIADLSLKGAGRLVEPFMHGKFRDMGAHAVAGLRTALDALGT